MNLFDLSGKKALVTGSTQGIGKAIAVCLAENGAKVFFHGSKKSHKCDDVLGRWDGAVFTVADLSEEGCAQKLYDQTGDIDILVLNASVQCRKAWNLITQKEFDEQITVNFKSTLELIRIYAANMAKKGWGRIVTIGSIQQYKPHKDMLVYAATKEAQMSMVKNLAKQLAPSGININNISPGVIATPRNAAALSDEAYKKSILDGIPCGRIGEPVDCAGAALLLCSDAGKYIAGADLSVDGGMHL